MNELSGVETLSDEQTAEVGTLTTEYRQVETKIQAATVAGDEPAPVAPASSGDPETRELRELSGRVELREYLSAAASGRDVEGAERELRDHLGLPAGGVPWVALAPRALETRADAVTPGPADVGVSQSEIIGRVFAGSATERLGVAMPAVPTGERLYPVITAGATPEMKAADALKEAQAATITPVTIAPTRLQARYLFRREDTARLAGMEEALRMDLSGALRETMDKQVLQGDGTAPNVAGFLATAANGGLAAGTAPGAAVSSFNDFAKMMASGVDGRYAMNEGQVSIVFGDESYRIAASAFANAGKGDVSASGYMRREAAGIMASANIPAAAANIQDGVLAKLTGMNAVAPVWENACFDPGRGFKSSLRWPDRCDSRGALGIQDPLRNRLAS